MALAAIFAVVALLPAGGVASAHALSFAPSDDELMFRRYRGDDEVSDTDRGRGRGRGGVASDHGGHSSGGGGNSGSGSSGQGGNSGKGQSGNSGNNSGPGSGDDDDRFGK